MGGNLFMDSFLLSILAPCSPFSAPVPPIPKDYLLFAVICLNISKVCNELETLEMRFCDITVTTSGSNFKIFNYAQLFW